MVGRVTRRREGMSTEDHESSGGPDGIQDTGDLGRLWDALEQLADRLDHATPAEDVDVDEHPEEPPPAAA